MTASSVIPDHKQFENAQRPQGVTIEAHADRSEATCNELEQGRREVLRGVVNPAATPRRTTEPEGHEVISRAMGEMYGHAESRGWSWPSHHEGTSAPEARLNQPDRRAYPTEEMRAGTPDKEELARHFGELLEHGRAGCQQPNPGIDMLPRHAATGDSFPIDQQIAIDIAEYEADVRGLEYRPATAEEIEQAPRRLRLGHTVD